MSLYDRSAASADRLLAKFGQLGAVRRRVTTGGGPSDPTGTTATTDYPCRFAIIPVDQRNVDGTAIRTGDWRVIMAPARPADALDFETTNPTGDIAEITPQTTDTVLTSEGELAVVDPGRLAPAGQTVLYDMIARGT